MSQIMENTKDNFIINDNKEDKERESENYIELFKQKMDYIDVDDDANIILLQEDEKDAEDEEYGYDEYQENEFCENDLKDHNSSSSYRPSEEDEYEESSEDVDEIKTLEKENKKLKKELYELRRKFEKLSIQ